MAVTSISTYIHWIDSRIDLGHLLCVWISKDALFKDFLIFNKFSKITK